MHVMERDRTEERIDRLEGEIREFRVETNARFERVDDRFDNVTAEFVAVRKEMKDGFEKLIAEFTAVRKEIKEGFESQQRTMFQGALMLCGTMAAGFATIAGSIVAVV